MSGIRRWLRLRNVERDVDEEIASYFQEAVRDLEARGWTRGAAEEEARRRFGDARQYRRELLAIDRVAAVRQRWAWRVDALRDVVKHAARSVARSPALSLGIVLAFALGIGANATMFETVERLLLRPPPHIVDPDGVRRVLVYRQMIAEKMHSDIMTYPDYVDIASAAGFAQVAPYTSQELTVGAGAEAERVRTILVGASYWPLLGVKPALGRFFTAAEDRRGAEPTAVISHGYWQRQFGGARSVLGRTIDFGHGPYTIVGVTPKGFTGIDLRPADLFVPFLTAGAHVQGEGWEQERNWFWLRAVARLAPGVSVAAAEAEATSLHRAGRAESATAAAGAKSMGYDSAAAIVAAPLLLARGPNAPTEVAVARWLLGVAGIVLLIACLNVANLLLARLIQQRREVSIRLALGISRARLVGQVVLEGVILGICGGVAALLLSWWGGSFAQRTLFPDVEWGGAPTATVLVLIFGLAVSAGLLSALVPALQASRRTVVEGLRSVSGGITRSTASLRAALSMVQAALSVVLLVGAGLFVRSLDRVRGGDFGLDPWHAAFALPSFREGSITPQERHALLQTGAERLARLPGVTAAAAARGVPFWSIYGTYLRIPGVDSIPRTAAGRPYVYMVTNDYFRTLRIERVRGRLFDERDTPTSARVVVVNESFARVVWPDGEPLGKCMHIGAEDAPCAEVVGIVRDARRFNLIEDDVALQYYVPLQQQENARPDGILLRIAGDSDRSTVLAAVQRELLGLDARVRFVRHMPLEELVAPELRKWRLGATMFSLFGLLALLVAAIGLYSVLAFDVAQRVREIGLRTALGASTRSIVALVVSRAVRITVVGVVVGAFVALVFAPRLRAFLYGVEPRDPLTFALVAVSLTVISLIAAGLPAWRAARVDPNVALRAE
jgi:predicted permease